VASLEEDCDVVSGQERARASCEGRGPRELRDHIADLCWTQYRQYLADNNVELETEEENR
jgi:hypothetical protein